MNIVRIIKRLLDEKPVLRRYAALFYHYMCFFIGRFFIKNMKIYPLICVNKYFPKNMICYDSFFGYYDKSPVNSKSVMLVNVTDCDTSILMQKNKFIYLSLIDLKAEKLLMKIQTNAYNWQQGCRAQWISDELFIFNDSVKNKYISKVYSLNGMNVKNFDYPVQDAYRLNYFLSINYKRLQKLNPEYGYYSLDEITDAELLNNFNDGIWKIDYDTGFSKLIISLEEIIRFHPNKDCLREAYHAVNHVMISPNGEKFIFIHRYYIFGERYDRLLLADNTGRLIHVLSDNRMVSHCLWIDDMSVLSYLRGDDNKDDFYLINIKSNTKTKMLLPENVKFGDGHPSLYGNNIVLDSYPNKYWYQHLYMFNFENSNSASILAKIPSNIKYQKNCRCDLHPRAVYEKKIIFFDSTFDGCRKMYYMNLK